ncbi:class I SAM-dependent methyltransferase [Siminovitchia sp. 179-K 8D1 HS]|uniref:class I SAM-dependent methyltransferase n=1 Tax=Siminovitchia sp. 179-K 8D1 HS TaxID=3142385 RepID=UPI0039A11A50
MNLEGVLSFTRTVMQRVVRPGGFVVDATVGNGHDTLFLAQLVGEKGQVFGYDIQQEAIAHTKKQLRERGLLERVTLFQTGHEHISETIPEQIHGSLSGAMFNLGYLPGGDKSIVTKAETTIMAVNQLLKMMASGGIIVLVVYHGHKEGEKERDQLIEFSRSLDQDVVQVLQYAFINQRNNAPFVLAFEKK